MSSSPTLFIFITPANFGSMRKSMQKSLLKNYENLVDQVPRSVKPNLHRLIIWEQGRGENSIQMQKFKINEALSQTAKELIESKLSTFTTEIRQYQTQASTPKSLLHIFILKNKLACLYAHLGLKNFAYDLLSDLWHQMMINFRCLMKLSSTGKLGSQKLDVPEDIPKSPYTFENTNDILGYFENSHSTAYLRIVTHSFLRFFTFSLSLGLYFQALSKLKSCLDFILNNVLVLARRNQWTKQQMMLFDISRNLWVTEVIQKCFQELDATNQFNQQKRDQNLSKVHISICSMLRNSVERIGLTLYQFDNYSIFPATIQKQIEFVYQKIKKVKQPWRNNKVSIESLDEEAKQELVEKSASLMRRQQFVIEIPEHGPNELKLRQLISDKMSPPEQIAKLLINFHAYSQVYLEVLQLMFVSLKDSPFGRVAKSLKLTVERATIMLGDWQDYEKVRDEPEQFKDHWPELHAIEQLYRLFFLFVKLLAGQLERKEVITEQVVKVLKNDQLERSKNTIFNIVGLVNQIFILYDISINAATIKDLYITEELQIFVIVDVANFGNLLSQASGWKILTEQVMLGDGQKVYELEDVKFREYNVCGKCNKQCSLLCTETKRALVQVRGKISLSNKKQQALFYMKSIVFQIAPSESESKLQLTLLLPQEIKNNLYKINSPQIVPLDQKQCTVYSQTWSPVTIKITSVKEATQILKIAAQAKPLIQCQEQDKQTEDLKKKMVSNLDISNLICVKIRKSKRKVENEADKKYYKLNEQLDLTINQASRLSFTIFVKGRKPDQIQRNSKRKNEQTITNERLAIEVSFRSDRLNKIYVLKQKTPSIVIRPLILLQYHAVQTCEQFTITNLRQLSLQVSDKKEGEEEQAGSIYFLEKEESVGTESRLISVAVAKYKKMKVLINLNDWFDSEHLLQQKCNTFRIWYKSEHSYSVLKPIQIQSDLIGSLHIPHLDSSHEQGYELVGKTRGDVEYLANKSINLWLVPIKSGNIILPQVWVNGKRGIWVNSLITNVQPLLL